MKLDLVQLTLSGASDKQLEKICSIYDKIVASKYSDIRVIYLKGMVRAYLDTGYINVTSVGEAFVICEHPLYRKKIQSIINA